MDESQADAILVRVRSRGGVTRGTGFHIGDGLILTCHHVVDGHDELDVQTVAGATTSVAVIADEALADLDVALLECDDCIISTVAPAAGEPAAGAALWTKGYQYSDVLPAALPLAATTTGTTGVAYTVNRRYRLASVIALAEATIESGTSGAPLIDRDWGVVVGVVNAKFLIPAQVTGCAVPLSLIAAACPRVRALLEVNARTVPAYGPYLNPAAARQTCDMVAERAVTRAIGRDLLLLDRYCERPATAADIARFLSGDHRILPVVGASGTGKSTELAVLARRESATRPVMLVACADVTASADLGLPGQLQHMLGDVGLEHLIAQLRTAGDRLLVLLDALNELPAPIAANEGSWLAATFEWIRAHDVQLVVTCRPDHWLLVRHRFPDDLRPRGSDAELEMHDFSEQESASALAAYDLSGRGLDPEDIAHPLLARIYWQLGGDGGRLGRHDALAAFWGWHEAGAAIDGGVPATSVRAVLAAAATRTANGPDLVLTLADVAELDGPALQVLVRRNVLVDVPEGLRFAFDEPAEWLQAQHATVDDLMACRPGTAVFALLRLEREQGAGALVEPLTSLLEATATRRDHRVDYLMNEVSDSVDDPAGLLPALRRWAELVVQSRPDADVFVGRALRRDELPIAMRFELLRVIARVESSYYWEHKHWQRLPWLARMRDIPSAGSVAADALRADPVAAAEQLVQWFDDTRHTRGGATPANVARGLLVFHSGLAFDEISELVASREADELWFLAELARAHPKRMAKVCRRWCAGTDPRRQALGTALARVIFTRPDAPPRARAIARTALEEQHAHGDGQVRAEALEGLFTNEATRALAFDEVLATFRAGGSVFSPFLIAAAMNTHHELVVEALVAAIAAGDPEERGRALGALAFRPLRRDDLESVLGCLDDSWLRPPLSSSLARWLEDEIGALRDSSETCEPLLDFARRAVTDGDDSIRRGVAMGATLPTSGGSLPMARRDLVSRAIEASANDELPSLVRATADGVQQHPWVLGLLVDRIDRIGGDYDLMLLYYAREQGFAEALAAELQRREPLAADRSLRRFADLVASGMSPGEAITPILYPASDR